MNYIYSWLNKSIRNKSDNGQKGFTIIELMIATSVFGFILLVASVAVISIGRIYHKALISTQTQEVTRRVSDDVSSSIQFSGTGFQSGDDGNLKSFCFGQDRYTYKLNAKVPDDFGLKHDIRTNQSDCTPNNTGGEQYLSKNMRLLQFDISNANPHKISIMIAYGDNDLLSIYETDGTTRTSLPLPAATCRANILGGTFCSVSGLETVVTKRVE